MTKKQRSYPYGKRKLIKKEASSSTKPPTWVWIVTGGVLATLLVLGLFYLGNYSTTSAQADIDGLQLLPDPGRGHINGEITYGQSVPAGGPHNPVWQNCGIYDEPVREENVVHSMEHGAVWLAYQPDLPAEQIELLRDSVRQARRFLQQPFIVLSPQPELDVPIVATAWRVQLELDDAADERLTQFLGQYQIGPFTPERGATCDGGIGEPLS